MRVALVFVVAVSLLAGCKKASVTTAPVIAADVSYAGVWSGCVTEPLVTCVPVTMTLTDSAVTDTSGTVTGTGNWGESVSIKGKFVNSTVSLDASTVGLLQGWSFAGILSGGSLSGSMSIPGNGSPYQAVFTKSP